MLLPARKPGQCAFCAFKSSQRSISKPLFRWQNGAKRYRSANNSRSDRFSERKVSYAKESYSRRHLPKIEENSYDVFAGLVWEQVNRNHSAEVEWLRERVKIAGLPEHEQRGAEADLEEQLAKYRADIVVGAEKASRLRQVTLADNPLFFHFRQAFIAGHLSGLEAEVRYRYKVSTIGQAGRSTQTIKLQKAVADLTHPLEWYPGTRAIQRTVHLHIGPTNSGKTYHALKRLEAAKTGIYAGPLRLLAHEVYTRFNAIGKKCALITGEEHRIPEGMNSVMNSCTVEMVPLNSEVEVAVIDEIQMLGDADRGWAWTQAFLGVQAKEVHLCGEVRTEHLVKSLCDAMGEKLVVHRYERLGRLETEPKPLGMGTNMYKRLQKGDAVILFSRVAIHAMKKNIEEETGKRCAVVYGSLPPETRAQQAALFNDPDNDYDFLVASNAVGMGLNLSIKRIIFDATVKHDGTGFSRLETSEIKQIGGRAGRYKSAHAAIKEGTRSNLDLVSAPSEPKSTTGYVTAFHWDDLKVVNMAMKEEVPQLKTAGLMPPSNIVMRFAAFFPPETPFSYILLRLKEFVTLHPSFHLCNFRESIEVLDLIQSFPITVQDRIIFMAAPVSLRDPGFKSVVIEFARALSERSGADLLDFKTLPLEILDMDIHQHQFGLRGYLRQAEGLHKALTMYLWLSYRFAGVYRSQALCFHIKAMLEVKIDECLAEASYQPRYLKREISKMISKKERKAKKIKEEMEVFGELFNDGGQSEEGKQQADFNPSSMNSKDAIDVNSEDTPRKGNIPVEPYRPTASAIGM